MEHMNWKIMEKLDKRNSGGYNTVHIQTSEEDEYLGKVPSREPQAVRLRRGTPWRMDF